MAFETSDALLRDPGLPSAEVLLGASAARALTRVLAPLGAHVLTADVLQVDLVPGRSLSVLYGASVAWSNAGAGDETIAATVRPRGEVGGTVGEVAGDAVGAWVYPADPSLPGLAQAHEPKYVGGILDGLGLPTGHIALEPRTYAMGGGAVIEVGGASSRLVFSPGRGLVAPDPRTLLFLKVARRGRSAAIERVHHRAAAHVPVAPVLTVVRELDLLALGPLDGVALDEALVEGRAEPPPPQALLAALDGLARVEAPGGEPRDLLREGREAAAALALVVPEEAGRLAEMAAALAGADEPAEAVVHGDLRPEHVLVGDGGALCGLLDLDDAGPGRRVDDLASLLGGLWRLAAEEPAAAGRIGAYAATLRAAFERVVDPDELHRRTAAVALVSALEPFRFQHERWRAACRERVAAAASLLAG